MRFALSRSVALVVAVLAAGCGFAQARYSIEPIAMREAGMLTCRLDPHEELRPESSRHVTCVFQRTGRSDMEHYDGRMDHLSADAGPAGSTVPGCDVRSWIVSTPGGEFRAGMLIGRFVAPASSTNAKAGSSAQLFINDRGESMLLDPYGWSNHAGLNQDSGSASTELRSADVGELR
jgi:hypothetical protein